MSSNSISPNSREILSARSTVNGKQEYLTSTGGALNTTATISAAGVATSDNQTNGAQKTQIVDAGGEAVTVTGGKLDVNASVDTTGLATSAKQDTGNTSLASIDGKITAVNTGAVVVSSSALPSGAATSALQTQPGVDIGDVTINNASGASAVNIQDGGNSITVDNGGTFAVQATLAAETTKVIGTVNQGTSPWVTSNATTSVVGNGTSAAAQRVTLANDSTGNIATIGTSVTPGTAATNLGKAEDAPHTSGDVGVLSLAVRNDSGAVSAGADGDYIALTTDAQGALRVDLNGTVSTNNSSTAALAGGAVFTGTSEDVLNYNEIRVTVIASHASATDGLSIQQSEDNTNWDVTDTYTVAAATAKTFSVPRQARYFRVVYTNGATLQTSFRLQTILNRLGTKSSSQRPGDGYSNEVDLEQEQSFLMGYNGTTWDRVRTVGTGVLSASSVLTAGSAIIGKVGIDQTTPGTTNLVALAANQSVNVAQMNGVATTMGNGVAGTGVQRVAIASDNTVLPGVGAGATGSAIPANASYNGLIAKTANPSAASDGNLVGALSDKLGKQVVVGSIRDLKGNQFTTITSSTSETTVVTAVASTFLDVYGVIVENTSATASKVTFKDSTAGTTQFEIYVPAGDTRGFMLPESGAFKQTTVNTNWTATCGTSVASIVISMLYVKNI